MMLKAIFPVKRFAKNNKLISAYTPKAKEAFYQMNICFPKRSFMYLAGLDRLVNKRKTGSHNYPLMIGCGDKNIPMTLTTVETWHIAEPKAKAVIFKDVRHFVNMDVPKNLIKLF